MNRRQFLALAATAPLTRIALAADRANDCSPTDYAALAAQLARLERQAIESQHPGAWRRLEYTSAIQLDAQTIVVFGVGTPQHNLAERARLKPFFTQEGPSLGEASSPDRRAWVLIVNAELSPGLQRELPRPAWEGQRDNWRTATLPDRATTTPAHTSDVLVRSRPAT